MATAASPARKDVVLHVYDVTNSDSEKTNNTIVQINRIFKDRIGLGGIFHSAIEVYGGDEWSFGFCQSGSGVFSCQVGKNPMYTYREAIIIGQTSCSNTEVNRILRALSREWPGYSYDLLARNCNHFCDAFCEKLGVPKIPGWVNRFANAGDTAMVVAGTTAVKLKQAKTEVVNASKVAYRFVANLATNNNNASSISVGNNNQGTAETASNSPKFSIPRFQTTWFKSIVSPGAKPEGSMTQAADGTIPMENQKSAHGSAQSSPSTRQTSSSTSSPSRPISATRQSV